MASEVSALREVAAAIGDEPSGSTSERGNDGRWTARLRLAANELASLDYSSLLGSVYCDFPHIWKSFPFFLVIYRIFCFIFWEFKNGSRVWIFCQRNKIIFHASLIVV